MKAGGCTFSLNCFSSESALSPHLYSAGTRIRLFARNGEGFSLSRTRPRYTVTLVLLGSSLAGRKAPVYAEHGEAQHLSAFRGPASDGRTRNSWLWCNARAPGDIAQQNPK